MRQFDKLMYSEQFRIAVQLRLLNTVYRFLYDLSDFFQQYASLSEEMTP